MADSFAVVLKRSSKLLYLHINADSYAAKLRIVPEWYKI